MRKKSAKELFEREKCLSQSSVGGKRKRTVIYIKVVVNGKGRDKGTERGNVHGEK